MHDWTMFKAIKTLTIKLMATFLHVWMHQQ